MATSLFRVMAAHVVTVACLAWLQPTPAQAQCST